MNQEENVKCKYCDCNHNKTPFSNEDVIRGELFAEDCDVDAYIEYNKRFDDYGLVITSYNYSNVDIGISYCPFCGRRLNKSHD